MASSIYGAAFGGAVLGVIVGDKDGKEGEYAAIGAGILGIGAWLSEVDRVNKDHDEDDEDEEEVVFQIHNDSGSETAIVLKKRGSTYIGPEGEHYDRLPAMEHLRQKYGS